jgi:hypothetical protein
MLNIIITNVNAAAVASMGTCLVRSVDRTFRAA